MASVEERRQLEFFADVYNSVNEPTIISFKHDKFQESPDAICTLSNDEKKAIELTSVGAPKGTTARKTPHKNPDLSPLVRILNRKLSYDYREEGVSGVWLLVHMRLTLPRDLVEEAVSEIIIPSRFEKVFLEWPVPPDDPLDDGTEEKININILELPIFKHWSPNLPKPIHKETLNNSLK